MGLFSNRKNEDLLEKITQPYVEKGFTLSKIISLRFPGEYFLIDTEHKKFAYTNQAKYKNNEITMYDFKDLLKYTANKANTPNGSRSYGVLGHISTTTDSSNKYEITLYINSLDIDKSSIKLLDWTFNSNSIDGISGRTEKIYNELIPVLEYILNNK